MRFLVFSTPEADQEIPEAALWYEEQQQGLGSEFLNDVELILNFLEDRPEIFQKKHGEIREAPLKKFPFIVLYRIEQPETITVFAFFHTSKDPKKKIATPLRRV
ncbi:MAG: type II toxin-antitoxin system RelE/ParE family toxin [Flavobacteriales bacterium]|nr:type II toxin-antitoxin system RelE/ParE family toxin [Flavobacteriales bacterium]